MGLSPQNVDFNSPDSLLPCALSALGRPILLAPFQGVWALREACYEIPRTDSTICLAEMPIASTNSSGLPECAICRTARSANWQRDAGLPEGGQDCLTCFPFRPVILHRDESTTSGGNLIRELLHVDGFDAIKVNHPLLKREIRFDNLECYRQLNTIPVFDCLPSSVRSVGADSR